MAARPRPAFWRVVALGVVFSVAGFGTIIIARRPSNDRPWAPEHARTPEVVFGDSLVRIANVRDFRPLPDGGEARAWDTRTYDLRALDRVWLVLTPFSNRWRGPAHAFVTFGFGDSVFVSVSVEARREVGEDYGVLKGLGRNFELIYVVGDERDVVARRAYGDADVYLYPIRADRDRVKAVFVDLLERASRLGAAPEFYHTVSNNCTSNLVASVNRVAPGRIRAGFRLLLPGYADEVARNLGLLADNAPIEVARERYRVNDRARAAWGADDFSRRIRATPEPETTAGGGAR